MTEHESPPAGPDEPPAEETATPTDPAEQDRAPTGTTADPAATVAAEPRGDTDEEIERPSAEEVARTGEDFVRGLMESMGLEGEISSRVEGEIAYIEIAGESLGILIGRRGQTLDALQEIARTAVQRRLRSRVRLTVDVESYRARRRASLADYAHAMAERAKERGTEIELEPMPAYERKIVHDAVSEVAGASSYSEGEDPHRKVVIRGEE